MDQRQVGILYAEKAKAIVFKYIIHSMYINLLSTIPTICYFYVVNETMVILTSNAFARTVDLQGSKQCPLKSGISKKETSP